jgi:protoheme ferro-lyase
MPGSAATGVTVSLVRDYSVDPGWVEAVAGSIRRYWEQHGRGQTLMFSFHGIPQRLADAGDPYPQRCEASAQAIANALGLGGTTGRWVTSRASAASAGCSRMPSPACGRWPNPA